jgi:hypothetical protein
MNEVNGDSVSAQRHRDQEKEENRNDGMAAALIARNLIFSPLPPPLCVSVLKSNHPTHPL